MKSGMTTLKTNPDLVPYAMLPEGEKDLDRNTVLETLKAIIENSGGLG